MTTPTSTATPGTQRARSHTPTVVASTSTTPSQTSNTLDISRRKVKPYASS